MGIGLLNSGLVPTRFLCLIAHLVILISMFINRSEYVNSCQTSEFKPSTSFDTEFIIALSLSIAFCVFELAPFVCGITLLNTFQCFISAAFHASAAISISFMIFFVSCSTYLWPIFAICSCLPLLFELIYLSGVWFFKRPIS